MKRIIISLSFIIASLTTIIGQSVDEAFRYSQLFYGGTARFQAMAGAFTSLGGDLSVLSLNPAGLGMFRSTDVSFTPQMYFSNSTTDFEGNMSSDNVYDLNINQFGVAVPVIKGEGSSGLVSLNFGYNYSLTNNFNSIAVINAELESSSMVDHFMAYAQGTHYQDLTGAEGMVFDVFMIDTLPGLHDSYGSIFSNYGNNANSTYGQSVRRVIASEGNNREHALSFAANFSDKIYLGITFGISSVFSVYQYDHVESDPNNIDPNFERFEYRDFVETRGQGFSVKFGAILRPVEALRVGFAVHSPVVYRLDEFYFDYVYGEKDDGFWDEFQSDPFYFSYTLTTPLRMTSGASLQLGKLGIISADYEFIDYKMARYSNASDNYNYYIENQDIKSVFDVAHNFRFGAEMRLTSSVYLRGGYARYGSGFNSDEDNRNNSYSVYSGGLGIRQNNFYFDLAYSLRSNTEAYFMYQNDNLNPATINYDRNMITATIGIKL
jgi:hypothetical protein